MVETQNCPCCGHIIDKHTGLTPDLEVRPNDLTVCLYCAEYLFFDDNLKLKKLKKRHLLNITQDELLMLFTLREIIRQKNAATDSNK